MTRRNKKLDELLNKLVDIIFWDGDVKTGVLEYGRPMAEGLPDSNKYSLFIFGEGYLYFYKTHVKRVKEHI